MNTMRESPVAELILLAVRLKDARQRHAETEIRQMQAEVRSRKQDLRRELTDGNVPWPAFTHRRDASRRRERPVLDTPPVTMDIAAGCGQRTAPADLLLAVAAGLAEGYHWWLIRPDGREWTASPETLHALAVRMQELKDGQDGGDMFVPAVELWPDAGIFEWRPCSSGGGNYGRRILMDFSGPDSSTARIMWWSGKWEDRQWLPSTFIASILILLPGAEDSGLLAELLEPDDALAAAGLAAGRAAQDAGEAGRIMASIDAGDPVEVGHVHKPGVYGGGLQIYYDYRPRCAWTLDGEKRRFAPALCPEYSRALLEKYVGRVTAGVGGGKDER